MPDQPDHNDDPAVTGVPEDTPAEVRPSATGLVTGPVGETDVEVAPVDTPTDENPADPARG